MSNEYQYVSLEAFCIVELRHLSVLLLFFIAKVTCLASWRTQPYWVYATMEEDTHWQLSCIVLNWNGRISFFRVPQRRGRIQTSYYASLLGYLLYFQCYSINVVECTGMCLLSVYLLPTNAVIHSLFLLEASKLLFCMMWYVEGWVKQTFLLCLWYSLIIRACTLGACYDSSFVFCSPH